MRKYRFVIITFVITIVLTVATGFLMKDKYVYIDSSQLSAINNGKVSYITILDYYNKLLDLKNQSAEIIRVRVTDKIVENNIVLAEAELLENYTNIYELKNEIKFIENASIASNGQEYICISDTSDVITTVGNEYVLAIVPSKYGKGYYDLAYPNASVMKVSSSGSYQMNYINDNVDLIEDIDGVTQLYMIDENMDFSTYDSFTNTNSKDMVIEVNSFIMEMYNKYQTYLGVK